MKGYRLRAGEISQPVDKIEGDVLCGGAVTGDDLLELGEESVRGRFGLEGGSESKERWCVVRREGRVKREREEVVCGAR